MSANKSPDAASPLPPGDNDEHEFQGSGAGAASALERMKAEHVLRHRRQHGAAGPGREEDEAPDR